VSLTGTATLVVAVIAALVSPVACMWLWSRVRGPRAVRGGSRMALFAACQVSTTLLVGVLVNDYGPYFISALICASLLTVLWHHRVALLTLFWVAQKTEPGASSRFHWWIRTLIVLAVSAIMISSRERVGRGSRLPSYSAGGSASPVT